MTENDKLKNAPQHAAEEEHHEHRAGHLDSGEPITDTDINYGSLIFIAVVGSLLTVAIVYFLLGLYGRSLRDEQYSKRVGKQYEVKWQQFEELRAAQLAELSGTARWTNPDKGLVSIPMDEAVKSALLEAQTRQAQDLRSLSQPAARPAIEDNVAADPAPGAAAENGSVPAATDSAAAEEGK